MDVEKHLEKLRKIERVDAPPFLFTRIKVRIDAANNGVPVAWKWALSCTFVLILWLNASVVLRYLDHSRENNVAELITAMHLSKPNSLYYE
jgi:hypothetical protein